MHWQNQFPHMIPLRNEDTFTIEALFPNFHHEAWVSYTLKSVLEGLASDGIHIGATVLAKGSNVTASYVHPLMHRYVYRLLEYWIKDPAYWTFKSAKRRLDGGDVAYFWLTSPSSMCEYFRSRGVMVVREMINCTLRLRRQELRKAYATLGAADGSGITDEMIERERQDLLATDAIFCPNPFVKSSVVEYGFPAERCIETSYGCGADHLGSNGRAVDDSALFTVAFVGTIDVRKGAPILLDAWVRSKIKGRLLLAGQMTAEVGERYAKILARPDVVQLGHVHDVGTVYRAADVFCCPTWEEGGPQVTLEAMSAGAVPIVTPMGTAGAFTAADDVGIVISPGHVDALSEALCSLADDRPRLTHLKRQAMARAAEYRWELVGQRRRAALNKQREIWLRSLRHR